MAGSLYVVSTPIGNLDDITVRALNTLKAVALAAAEDTRRTGLLLRHFGIPTPVTSLHEHNEAEKLPVLLARLAGGADIALVSDAGTPLVCDPGQRLISEAVQSGIRVVPIPGASAVLAALSASGYPGEQFVFAGFAPSRAKDRKQWLGEFVSEPRTIIFFEAPHRIASTLQDMAELFGVRPITIARELTKLHESIIHTTAEKAAGAEILEKGELTIVVAPLAGVSESKGIVDDATLNEYFCHMTENTQLSRRAAAAATAAKFGLSPNEVYARLERHKAGGPS